MKAENGPAHDRSVYRTLSPIARVGVFLFPLLWLAAALAWTVTHSSGTTERRLGWLLLAIGVGCAHLAYRMVHTIVLREKEASIEFRSFLGRRTVAVAQISSIVPARFFEEDLVVRHSHGSERLHGVFAGREEVLVYVRRGNPGVSFGGILDR